MTNSDNREVNPWDEDIDEVKDMVKEREVSVPRAIFTLIEDFIKSRREGRPFPISAIKGLVFAMLFGRTAIVVGSILGSAILIFQTYMIFRQNKLISNQNQLFKVQNNLSESNRRAALVFELSSILDEIDEELDEIEKRVKEKGYVKIKNLQDKIRRDHLDDEGNFDAAYLLYDRITNSELDSLSLRLDTYPDRNKFYVIPQLSARLEGRIIASSKALRPYKYLNNKDSLNDYFLSPERGQLLISLVESGIALQNIIPKSDFSYADLEGTNFVRNIEYNFVNTETINLEDLNISNGNVQNAHFTDIFMDNCNFDNALFENTTFHTCTIEGGIFTNTNLKVVSYSACKLSGAEFINSALLNVKFEECNLAAVELNDLTMDKVWFDNCWFSPYSSWVDDDEYKIDLKADNVSFTNCYTNHGNWVDLFTSALKSDMVIDSLTFEKLTADQMESFNDNLIETLDVGRDVTELYKFSLQMRSN